jgi:hypothetical protein
MFVGAALRAAKTHKSSYEFVVASHESNGDGNEKAEYQPKGEVRDLAPSAVGP